ncbi:DUF4129 domain-containing protein [Flavobacterium sp.]|uniref:DUF4129 domain-containing protein n=1 Tax=Flavobacterium sp. TaxID=239 RepID=UPI002489AE37|nr:DUF4129 domain-containing protein [Flavobacterium sp.]MDI1316504.1 DUF4129 domain-containing protein [Flavobacterium sp.]
MNKFLLIFWLLVSVPIWSQDSSAVAKNETIKFTEKDIVVDQSDIISKPKLNPNFKQKYKATEFQYEVVIAQKGAWERFEEWLAYWFKKIFGLSSMDTSSKYVEYTLKTIAGLIVAYVIYLIVKIILNKEGQWIFGKSTTRKILTDEEIEKNLIYVDFEKLLQETLKNGDNRLAIRYYYLWLLKRLAEKNIIEWHTEKTNSDYAYEIKSTDLRTDFQYLSYLYNYIWYGEFEMNELTFLNAKTAFEKTLKSLNK